MLNKEFFYKTIGVLSYNFNFDPKKEQVELIYDFIKEYSDQEFEEAAKDILKTSRFFPKIADFIERLEGTKELQAIQAFEVLDYAVRTIGSYQNVLFQDTKVAHIVDTLSDWVKIGNMDDETYKFFRLEFIKTYKALSGSFPKLILRGIVHGNNRSQPKEKIQEIKQNCVSYVDYVYITDDKETKNIKDGKAILFFPENDKPKLQIPENIELNIEIKEKLKKFLGNFQVKEGGILAI